MRRKQARLCGVSSISQILNNSFGFKNEDLVTVCLKGRYLHTWRGKDVMSFTYLLSLTIAQERASRRETETEKRNTNHNKACIPRRVLITVLYCGCFFSFGTTMAILGPTLIELGHLVHHGLDMMSWLFFTQAAYALLGASVAGIVLDRYVDISMNNHMSTS